MTDTVSLELNSSVIFPVKLKKMMSMAATNLHYDGRDSNKMLRSSDWRKNCPNKQAGSIKMHVIQGEQKRAYHEVALMRLGFIRCFNFPAYKVEHLPLLVPESQKESSLIAEV